MISRTRAGLLAAALVVTGLAGCAAPDLSGLGVGSGSDGSGYDSGTDAGDDTGSGGGRPTTHPGDTSTGKPKPGGNDGVPTTGPTFVGKPAPPAPPDVRIGAINVINPDNRRTTCEVTVELHNEGDGPATGIVLTARVEGTASRQVSHTVPFHGPSPLAAHASATYQAPAPANFLPNEALDLSVRLQVDGQPDRTGGTGYIYCPVN